MTSAMVAAVPVRFAVSGVPATVFLTMSATRVYAALASGEAKSPERPTGRIQALPS